jgi:hypothetical protein
LARRQVSRLIEGTVFTGENEACNAHSAARGEFNRRDRRGRGEKNRMRREQIQQKIALGMIGAGPAKCYF